MTDPHTSQLANFFRPRTVAVIGASAAPGKLGRRMIDVLLDSESRPEVFPVNPKGEDILGLRSYRSITDVPSDVDLAVVVVPAALVPRAVAECTAKDVGGGIVIISSGFGEAGGDGQRLQDEVLRAAAGGRARVVGPNCGGTLDLRGGFCANFSPIFRQKLPAGGVSVVSQSGGFASSLYQMFADRGLGFSKVATTGNECDVAAAELIRYLADDDDTQVIVTYAEQFREPRTAMRLIREASLRKPVIIEKAGRTTEGGQAAASHTAALATNHRVTRAAIRSAGAVGASCLDEVVDYAAGLTLITHGGRFRPVPHRGVAVLSQGGGAAVELTDLLKENGLEVPELSAPTRAALDNLLPEYSATRNPVDFTAGLLSHPEWIADAVRLADRDPGVAAVVLALTSVSEDVGVDVVTSVVRDSAKPVFLVLLSEIVRLGRLRDRLADVGLPAFYSTQTAVRAVGAAYEYSSWRAANDGAADVAPLPDTPVAECLRVASAARAEGRTALTEHETKDLLAATGIAVTAEQVVTTERELLDFAHRTGFPLTLKIVSPDLPHKTDVGGVRLALRDTEELVAARTDMLAEVRRRRPDADIRGVLVQEHCSYLAEAIVGVTLDPEYGPTIACGLGGTAAELFDEDVAMRPASVSHAGALAMIRETRLARLLGGWRGQPMGDIDALADLIVRVGNLVAPEEVGIAELDINPVAVRAQGQGVVVLDASAWLTANRQ